MFEKSEIINAIEIAKEQHLEKLSSFGFELFLKSAILNIINKNRWYLGASEHEGTFMTKEQFERIIQKRKFISTSNYVGLKSKNPIIKITLPKRKEMESFFAQLIKSD